MWSKQTRVHQKESAIYTFMSGHFSESNLELNNGYLKEKSRMFSVYLMRKWQKWNRKLNEFSSVYPKWLEEHLILKVKGTHKKPRKSAGRPKALYHLKSLSGRRQQADELARAQNHNQHLLIQAAMQRGLLDLAAILKLLLLNPAINKLVELPVRCSTDEALAFILDQGLTKEQYCAIREEARCRRADVYPNYKEVAEKKKLADQPILILLTP